MLKPEQLPKEVITAFREALKRDDTSFEDDFCAALNAWPGMSEENRNGFSFTPLPHGTAFRYTALILPLTENPSE